MLHAKGRGKFKHPPRPLRAGRVLDACAETRYLISASCVVGFVRLCGFVVRHIERIAPFRESHPGQHPGQGAALPATHHPGAFLRIIHYQTISRSNLIFYGRI
ncbi:MAG: hypothetical protein KatS3mg099_149 [Candidatus Parcubacteria bacterium]|nr:MAG: hypothetical protein KatS3mg099_149 [Candidatus Parcubacteria bacterium]